MNDYLCGSEEHVLSPTIDRNNSDGNGSKSGYPNKNLRANSYSVSLLSPSDPLRQAKRLPIRILKMLTAHTSHLLHPEYLQPLTSAPLSIELDAKKSPLALLAQTCSQIGKPDPPPPSKLSSLPERESSTRSTSSSLRPGDQHQPLEDKSSFKPYSKVGGECRKDVAGPHSSTDKAGFRDVGGPHSSTDKAGFRDVGGPHSSTDKAGFRDVGGPHSSTDKVGFRAPGGGNGSGAVSCPSITRHTISPNSRAGSPLQSAQAQSHRQTQSPPTQQTQHSQPLHTDAKAAGPETGNADSSSSSSLKKESEPCKSNSDIAQLANSSNTRASANSSNASSDSSPHHDGKAEAHSSQTSLGSGHIAPVSPFKAGHSVFPLPPSSMGYHGSIVGAYAGYPSQFVSGLDHAKSSLVGGGMGVPGKHPSSSPLTGASPPSFMQGLCRDPYCLAYPNAPHLGGSSCSSCVHDPSSSLKSGFPLVYPSHPLHSLHPSSLSSSITPSLSHPLYSYGFMLPNESLPHACNWVSAGGPCDKRFTSSEELLSHLRTHTALSGMDSKLLSAYHPSVSSAASCHLHLPPISSPGPGSIPSSFSLRGPHSLGLARYHPYSKAHLPGHSLPTSTPYYSPYALYSQRLGSASALGYQ